MAPQTWWMGIATTRKWKRVANYLSIAFSGWLHYILHAWIYVYIYIYKYMYIYILLYMLIYIWLYILWLYIYIMIIYIIWLYIYYMIWLYIYISYDYIYIYDYVCIIIYNYSHYHVNSTQLYINPSTSLCRICQVCISTYKVRPPFTIAFLTNIAWLNVGSMGDTAIVTDKLLVFKSQQTQLTNLHLGYLLCIPPNQPWRRKPHL